MKHKRANRTMAYLVMICSLVGVLVISNVIYTMVSKQHFRSATDVLPFGYGAEDAKIIKAKRGEILDRKGEVLAQDQDTYTIFAYLESSRKGLNNVPAYVVDKKDTAEKLAPLMDMSVESIMTYFEEAEVNERYLTYFGTKGKTLTTATKKAIEALELPGIDFDQSSERYYPQGEFASHLLGFAKYDEDAQDIVGQMGLESYFNEQLTGASGELRYRSSAGGAVLPGTKHVSKEAKDGYDVKLTLDKNVQIALEDCLETTMEDFGAKRAWGMIVEVETGKILGWSSYPTFDMNERKIDEYLNVPADYTYEPGSVMKGVTYAAAIDANQYPSSDATFQSKEFYIGIDANGNAYRANSFDSTIGSIKDAEGKDHGTINFSDGFKLSSNIGICELLTKYFSTNDFETYLDRFGFFKPVGMVGVHEEGGKKNYTYPIEKLSAGFGQGSSVTATQMVQAYTALFNDGKMMKPYYIDQVVDKKTGEVKEQYEPTIVSEPIRKESADTMRDLMNNVMNDEKGTGYWRYHMEDVPIIGKTGTGQIFEGGSYTSATYINSVMAAAPYEDPKVMMYYAFESKDYKNFSGDPFKTAFRRAMIATGVTGDPQSEGSESESTWQENPMPQLENHSVSYAKEKIKQIGAVAIVIGNGDEVVKQSPSIEESVISSQKVFLFTQGDTIEMPDMVGYTRKEVMTFASLANIHIVYSGNGIVSEQSIAAGEIVNAESELTITLK